MNGSLINAGYFPGNETVREGAFIEIPDLIKTCIRTSLESCGHNIQTSVKYEILNNDRISELCSVESYWQDTADN